MVVTRVGDFVELFRNCRVQHSCEQTMQAAESLQDAFGYVEYGIQVFSLERPFDCYLEEVMNLEGEKRT